VGDGRGGDAMGGEEGGGGVGVRRGVGIDKEWGG